MVSPSRRKDAVEHLRRFFAVSEWRACRFVGQQRFTQRYVAVDKPKERAIVVRLHELAAAHPRYGYRRRTAMLRQEGWNVNGKRIYRLWRQKGLKVPQDKKPRTRLGNSEKSCSTESCSPPCTKPRSCSNSGGSTTTIDAPTAPSATCPRPSTPRPHSEGRPRVLRTARFQTHQRDENFPETLKGIGPRSRGRSPPCPGLR